MGRRWKLSMLVAGLVLSASVLTLPAMAQFGFGFGSWGGNFGSWVEVWPWAPRCCNRSQTSRPTPQLPPQQKGYLEGEVTVKLVCPTEVSPTTCANPPSEAGPVVVAVEPLGATQGLTTRTNAQGYYRLVLPPGSYQVYFQHPGLGESAKVPVNIFAGQTTRQDFQLQVPAR